MSRLVAAALTVLGTASLAATWPVTPEELDTLVPTPGQLVLVAAAGEPLADARDAARAVERALLDAAKMKLVMNDSALGPLGLSSDDEVRRKAATVPHDVLIIVRVFPQGADRTPVALLVATGPGTAAPRSVTVRAGGAEKTAAPTPPPPPPPGMVTGPTDPRESEYEAGRIHFGQNSLIPGRKMSKFVLDGPAYEGRTKLTTEQLFARLGRKDLTEAWQQRTTLRTALGYAGIGAMVLGGGLMVLDFTSPCARRDSYLGGICLLRRNEGLWIPGVITAGLGAIAGIVAIALPPFSPDEVGSAVEAHNKQLRTNLGLTRLELVPTVTPEGGAVAVRGAF